MILRIIGFVALFIVFCISSTEAAFSLFLYYFGVNFCTEFTKYNLLTILTVFGFIYGILAIVGLVGLGFRKRSFNYIYGIIFSFLIIFPMVVSILFVKRLIEIETILNKCSENKLSLKELKYNKFINYVQREYKCCGIFYTDDWKEKEFPPTCCADEPQVCQDPVPEICALHLKKLVVQFGNLIVGGLCMAIALTPVVIICVIKSLY
ncbi:hypothetical protein RF11_07080 [Thelohanellus kitauei]|uniref:Tetraspanin n=1 Tax=Thelohanellus kitauei TaxID=669202 RepID=A0A0C2IZE7_THEKT|nr:hypothetical protein RF11_07080 [Thelohanellus kitauei]